MAYDDKGTAKEVASLKARYPKRGIDPTIPAGVREVLRDREDDRMMSSGEKNRYAKGGSVKGSGCEQRGLRKCKVV
jgi:hypothetical protein